MGSNVFGNPITNKTLEQMPDYIGKKITRKDRAEVAMNMKNAENVEAVAEGVELIYRKFMEILKKQGVEPIDTKEADFNVDLHEAIAQLPAPNDGLKGKVMDCTLTGYKMNEKVIRHSQVVVGL